MTARGQFEIRHIDTVPVVDCVGEIDLTNAHEFEAILSRAAADDRGGVIVSFAQTTYLDSQGIRILFSVGERLMTMRQRLVIVAPTGGTPRRILEITGIDVASTLVDSVEDARALAQWS
ncbi:MAG: STAS domain-containing protein [Armatimonadota bacterium]